MTRTLRVTRALVFMAVACENDAPYEAEISHVSSLADDAQVPKDPLPCK